MGKITKKPWYKTGWKLTLITIGVAVIFGIPGYILLFKPQKVIIDKPTNDLKIEPKPAEPLIETESSPKATSLRKLKPLETGKYLNEVPDNIYGFTYPWGISLALGVYKELHRVTLASERHSDSFEIQKFNNKYYLVGFISDESYAKAGTVNKSNTLESTLFALPWENFKNLVAVPFESISKINTRSIDVGAGHSIYVLDIVTNNIILGIQGHDLNKK